MAIIVFFAVIFHLTDQMGITGKTFKTGRHKIFSAAFAAPGILTARQPFCGLIMTSQSPAVVFAGRKSEGIHRTLFNAFSYA